MTEPCLEIHRRCLPHWKLEGSTYFVTFQSVTTPFHESERMIVLNHIRSGHSRFYSLSAAVVIPDHGHLLLRPAPEYDLPRVMKGIKDGSARLLYQSHGTTGTIWQDESYDRIVQDEAEFTQKLNYIVTHPVNAGLSVADQPYTGLFVQRDDRG